MNTKRLRLLNRLRNNPVHFYLQKLFSVITGIFFAGNALALEVNGIAIDVQGLDARQQTQLEKNAVPILQKINNVTRELKQLNQQGELKQPSAELLELLSLCDEWETRSDKKFTCRLGALQQDWQAAAASGELPDRTVLRRKAIRHLQLQWSADKQVIKFSSQAKAEGLQINLQGLWQGWVITQLSNVARVQGVTRISYGNLFQYFSDNGELVRLQNLEPVSVTITSGQVLAVVDQTANRRKVGHNTVSDILVPADGWPVEFAPSLLVRANNAIEADVMAHSLQVVPAYETLASLDKNPGLDVLVITETGKLFASKQWYAKDTSTETPWPSSMKCTVDFEIPELSIAEYKRPYVALWISDTQGNAIRQLFVAGNNTRWLSELRQWWRKLGRADASFVDAVASATRRPGRYHLEWDGRNLNGQKISPGDYVLHAEVAREHGEHEHLEIPFVVDGKSFQIKQQGKHELGEVTLSLQ